MVKLVLEEWSQWLKGTKTPFLVWTDHKILEYIRSVKRLNLRPARWLLFFAGFNFSLSFHPGSQNIKPDALSCQFLGDDETAPNPDTMLPAPRLVATLTLEIEERVKASLEGQPGPSSCPQDCLFVPQDLRSDVLQWAPGSQLTCHPCIQRTKEVLQNGGQPWNWTLKTLSVLAQSAASIRLPAGPQVVTCSLCLCPRDPGHISPCTL